MPEIITSDKSIVKVRVEETTEQQIEYPVGINTGELQLTLEVDKWDSNNVYTITGKDIESIDQLPLSRPCIIGVLSANQQSASYDEILAWNEAWSNVYKALVGLESDNETHNIKFYSNSKPSINIPLCIKW